MSDPDLAQVVDLACRVERPGVLEILETKGLTPFLEGSCFHSTSTHSICMGLISKQLM